LRTQREVKSALCEVLGREVDALLIPRDFARRNGSIDYVRQCVGGMQTVRISFHLMPKYEHGACCHVYPSLRMFFPDVGRVGLAMVGGDKLLLASAPEVTLNEPIDFVIPKEHHVRWFAYDDETLLECIRSMKNSLATWVIPFLDEYRTPASLVFAYEQRDVRFLWQRHFYIYVAAAYILASKPDVAMRVLEENLGQARPKRQYAKAFEYVKALLTHESGFARGVEEDEFAGDDT
jgi:hypothetical protein